MSNHLIDLNTADERLLLTIPGIGQTVAASIVEYREDFGPFVEMSELEYVRGIGPETAELIEEHAFIDPCVGPSPDTSHWLPEVDSLEPVVTVSFLDVGQGDAILVQAEEGMTLLFDGGPDPGGPLEPPVVFRLRELGVDTIHVLAFSHPHSDHIGGLSAVIGHFAVLEVLDPGMVFASFVYEDLLASVAEAGCSYVLMREGMELELSDRVLVTVESMGMEGADLDLNENSALLRVTCGDFSALLTGDIEVGAEMLLTPSAMPVTVLKVPHHGSLSSAFPPYLRRLSPQVAVFSAGRGNPFGHPNPGVVETYSEMGCVILRTDTEGTIVVQSDGEVFSTSAAEALYRPGDDIEH
ncbi:MAG: helix-hairpin-helix domain-containing protein [Candidatus Fermentibacteraceae bacterium]|nr:helix-hairpin-helix domain-containing protein [Candidatus Fermentibacteraceae bacterium]MBN2608834.1 helix-hairpin-helix domain-containing protein [Candidatus Fermentibacteraceae bacterium]